MKRARKPWEENWIHERPGSQEILTSDGAWVARFSPAPGVSPDCEAARAKLAAAAPLMARMLLTLHEDHGPRHTFDWAYFFAEIEKVLDEAGVEYVDPLDT